MRKLLVLTEAYPSNKNLYNMSYVHSRSLEYLAQGVAVEVLSFSAKKPYMFESIKVYSKADRLDFSKYDAVISHAPNIRNHYRFIKLNYKKIKTLCLFFHGHEVLKYNDYYPSPYSWQKQDSLLTKKARNIYDSIKTSLIKGLLEKDKVKAVFVSRWMLDEGSRCLKIDVDNNYNSMVIHNAINTSFYQSKYKHQVKKADFITIRPLDGRKYAIDKVVELANSNPQFTFHIYGRGEFFENVSKPQNVKVFSEFIKQSEIPNLLNHYRAAIMPTRLDAQGVMVCEMASYGIPVITSDLDICREMLDGFNNVVFIPNNKFDTTNISSIRLQPLKNLDIIEKFNPEVLAKKELEFIFS